MLRLPLPFLLLAFTASAQTVEGRIVNVATGAGIPFARVSIEQGEKTLYNAIADAGGQFHIEGVKDGTYLARYSARGYEFAVPIPPKFQVTAGPPIRIEGKLLPLGHVTGRVLDGRGDPVPKADVELQMSTATFAAWTDEKGNFDIGEIFPANFAYTLFASAPPGWKPPPPDPETARPRRWAQTFYPGVPVPEQAATVAMPPGVNLEGVEIRLLAVPVHAVRGVVLKEDGTPAAKIPLTLGAGGLSRVAPEKAESASDGSFEFLSVPRGNWRVMAQTPDGGGTRPRAFEWVDVADRDIEGLKLRLAPPFPVHGTVVVAKPDGAAAPRPPGVGLTQLHGGLMIAEIGLVFPNQEDGRFRIDNVYPGEFHINTGPAPAGYYLDSVRLGESTVGDLVELSAASPELALVYKTNGGTVQGTVEECALGRVFLVPQDQPLRGYYIQSACDEAGRYRIADVRPGSYYAVALPRPLLFGRDTVNTAFLQSASQLTVRPGETTQLDLALSAMR